MTNRFPLIFNGDSDQIQELAADDNLDLQGSGIRNGVGAQFTGVVTATTFDGNATSATSATSATTAGNLTGTPQVTVSTITGVAATFTGNLSVEGQLTYEDVTNVDSIGVITARSGVHVGTAAAGTLITGDTQGIGIGTGDPTNKLHVVSADGDGILLVAPVTPHVELKRANSTGATGNIDWIGSTNVIGARIGVNDDVAGSMQFKLGGTGTVHDTKLSILSTGVIGINTTVSPGSSDVTVRATNPELSLQANDSFSSFLMMGDVSDYDNGFIEYDNTAANSFFKFVVNTSERLRIDSRGTFKFSNGLLVEQVEIDTTGRNGVQAVNLDQGMVYNITGASGGTWTPNFRTSSTVTLNSSMAIGECVSPTMIVAKGATTHFSNSIQIDGSAVTPEFLGGAPTDGGDAGTFDIYSYSIIKTADATFTVFASVSTYS